MIREFHFILMSLRKLRHTNQNFRIKRMKVISRTRKLKFKKSNKLQLSTKQQAVLIQEDLKQLALIKMRC